MIGVCNQKQGIIVKIFRIFRPFDKINLKHVNMRGRKG